MGLSCYGFCFVPSGRGRSLKPDKGIYDSNPRLLPVLSHIQSLAAYSSPSNVTVSAVRSHAKLSNVRSINRNVKIGFVLFYVHCVLEPAFSHIHVLVHTTFSNYSASFTHLHIPGILYSFEHTVPACRTNNLQFKPQTSKDCDCDYWNACSQTICP